MGRCLPLAVDFEGIVFRGCAPFYATLGDLLAGEGSRLHGGRWNPKGGFPTAYTSLELQTAVEECLATSRYYGWPDETNLPLTFVAIRVKLHLILDLRRDGPAYETLGMTRDLMVEEDWHRVSDPSLEAATQSGGRIARKVGFEGLFVPSAANASGSNLVWFPGRLHADSELKIVNADKLKPRP
jgi:RES domain-containing protein